MRIGIRLAISALVLMSIAVSALSVHLLWWRTADDTSQTLARTINEQIVLAVEQELLSITTEAKSVYIAIGTMLGKKVIDLHDAEKREFVFLSQLVSQPTISWVMFGWPNGEFFAAHKLGDSVVESVKVDSESGMAQQQIARYEFDEGELKLQDRRREPTAYRVTGQEWFSTAMQSEGSQWFKVTAFPGGDKPSAGLAGPIDVDGKRAGVLSVMIEYARLSRFLSQLAVGKSGAAFLLDRDGSVIATPDPDANEVTPQRTDQPLLPIARNAMKEAYATGATEDRSIQRVRRTSNDEAYDVTLTPLAFPGWHLATVIPEKEFLGPVQATIRNLMIALTGLVIVAAFLSAWLARRLISDPLVKVVGEIKHVERFDLDQVTRHRSRIAELENLSAAIADMSGGLSAFRKFIPADLVRTLVSSGVDVRPGGAIRPLTVMFADIAGFTGLSERLGDKIIPLLSRYLDVMSAEIAAHDGTIDKFIGDAVMAFWGAPAANPDHALSACRAMLACQRALQNAGICDDLGQPLRIRIGLNSGEMLVGNIGSDVRLNYTVIGDAVNVASRLESVNKQYGTQIIIGEETRRLAGARIVVRELDRLTVYGRSGGMRIYELLGLADDGAIYEWISPYEDALRSYRAKDFAHAAAQFNAVLDQRPGDTPSLLMIERCQTFIASPPDAAWDGGTVAETK